MTLSFSGIHSHVQKKNMINVNTHTQIWMQCYVPLLLPAVWSLDFMGVLGRTGYVRYAQALQVPPTGKHSCLHGAGESKTRP